MLRMAAITSKIFLSLGCDSESKVSGLEPGLHLLYYLLFESHIGLL